MSCTSCQTIEGFDAKSPDRWESKWRDNWAELEKKEVACGAHQASKCLYNAQGEFICDDVKYSKGVPNEFMLQRPYYEKNVAQFAGK